MAYISAGDVGKNLSRAGFSAIHFNARSLKKHHAEISAQLQSFMHKFSAICLSETWLSDADRDLYGFPDYSSEYAHRAEAPYGGSAIFISKHLAYIRRNDLQINVPKCESVWIEFDDSFCLPNSSKKTVLGSIYRSPSSNSSDFCLSFSLLLDKLSFENKNVLIMGDFNFNLLDTCNPTTAHYLSCFSSYGFQSLINVPTRAVDNAAVSLLDHILSNLDVPIQTGVVECDVTDHFPVFLQISKTNNGPQFEYRSTFDKEKFIDALSNVSWSSLYSFTDPDAAMEKFISIFTNVVISCTTVKSSNRRYDAPRSPWLSEALLRCLRKKENLFKKTKRKPFNSNLKERYKRYASTLSSLLKCAKKQYYERQLQLCGHDTKKKWKILNEFLNNTSQNKAITSIIYNDSCIVEPTAIANAFSTYFANITHESDSYTYSSAFPRCAQSFYLRPTSPEEVESVIRLLKAKGPGIDGIHGAHIKFACNLISATLSHIFNLVFQTGVFPNQLKLAKVVPVFKKGDHRSIENYRPISILSFLDKVLEKLIELRLSRYLTKFEILTSCQFGFRSGLSTDNAIACFTDKIKSFIDCGKYAGSVFIDLSKAFDTINHSILLKKLELYGIVGPALTLLKSFLSNRRQVVCVNGQTSHPANINKGVPQGSILGPLLFLTYINDLPQCLTTSQCILYADDTTIFSSDNDVSNLVSKLQADLFSLQRWCLSNKLSINVSKTCFMLYCSPNKTLPTFSSLYLNSKKIAFCSRTNFLGVVIDSNFKFDEHVISIVKKASFGIRALIRARPYFNTQILLGLYFAFVHCHLTYCITSWGSSYATHLSPLVTLQKQAIRVINSAPRRSSSFPLFQQLRVLPLTQIYRYSLGILFFKILNRKLVLEVFPVRMITNTNNTRFSSQNNFLLPKIRTNYGKHTILFSAISFWNSLPSYIKTNSFYKFKTVLRNYLLDI